MFENYCFPFHTRLPPALRASVWSCLNIYDSLYQHGNRWYVPVEVYTHGKAHIHCAHIRFYIIAGKVDQTWPISRFFRPFLNHSGPNWKLTHLHTTASALWLFSFLYLLSHTCNTNTQIIKLYAKETYLPASSSKANSGLSLVHSKLSIHDKKLEIFISFNPTITHKHTNEILPNNINVFFEIQLPI